MAGSGTADSIDDGPGTIGLGTDFRVSDGVLEPRNTRDPSTTRMTAMTPPVLAKDSSVAAAPQQRAKSTLGKQLGRFGGAVSGRVKRGH